MNNPDILTLLRNGPMRLTAILKATGLGANELFAILNTLEKEGKITITTGGWNESALVKLKETK